MFEYFNLQVLAVLRKDTGWVWVYIIRNIDDFTLPTD